jgi:hypothetical protein
MRKHKKTIEIRGLGKMSKRAAILMAVLVVALAGSAVVSTGIAVNYAILKARVLFLEKVLQPDVVPEEVDLLYERALALEQQINIQPDLSKILDIVERVEKRLDKPVVTSAKQLEALKGGQVYLVGVITKVTTKAPHLFINVNDVFVPLFNMEQAFRNLKPGWKVAIAGRVQEYNGELEVVPDSGYDVLVLEAG